MNKFWLSICHQITNRNSFYLFKLNGSNKSIDILILCRIYLGWWLCGRVPVEKLWGRVPVLWKGDMWWWLWRWGGDIRWVGWRGWPWWWGTWWPWWWGIWPYMTEFPGLCCFILEWWHISHVVILTIP